MFIQIAEKNHMIEQITDMQFRRICRFLKENRELMSHLLNVKVNLSSLDLMRNDCSSHFIRMMDEYEILHDWIQFEITETVATEYSASLGMVVDELTAAGIRLCLDDFGSGYANLNTVMRLPFLPSSLTAHFFLIYAMTRSARSFTRVLWKHSAK